MKKYLVTDEDGNRCFYYLLSEEDGEVELHPVSGEFDGSKIARSTLEYSSYGYTHGGKMFRAAVEKAHKIKMERRGRKT
jgi:hypothetical protein